MNSACTAAQSGVAVLRHLKTNSKVPGNTSAITNGVAGCDMVKGTQSVCQLYTVHPIAYVYSFVVLCVRLYHKWL